MTQLRTVGEAMTRRIATVRVDDVIDSLDEAMHRLRVRHLPVVDDKGKLVGLLSHPDLLNAASFMAAPEPGQGTWLERVPVGRIMQQELLTAHPDDSLVDAGKLMWDAKVGCLPVCERDGTLVGIITEADFVAIAVSFLGGEIKKSDVEELAHAPRYPRLQRAL